jgi:endoglucanase
MRRTAAPRFRSILVFVSSVLIVASVTSTTPAHAVASTAFVRVNQVGYPTLSAKRAFLMASDVETGATFAVKDGSNSTLFSAAIGSDLGSWSTAYPHVYALDFTSLTAAGTYSIAVSGSIPASSPTFKIGTGSSMYAQPLANARSFYGNERDGANYIPSALRTAPAHLNDANAMTYLTPHANQTGHFKGDLTPLGVRIDASGGWWDAGDYLKFVQTSSYTEDLLLAGVRDLPAQMGSASTTSNFTAEAKFGIQWLLKMWDDPTGTLYYQVGIGTGNAKTRGDHDIWRLPQADDTYGGSDPLYRYIRNRPVFRAGPPGSPVSPNLAGRDAAAFAMCFQVYKSSAPTLAAQCLHAAEHIFDLADTAPTKLLTVIPYSFYPESEWRDDLELGATELYLAVASGGLPIGLPHTQAGYYLSQAAHWANAYMTGPNDAGDTLNLYDVSGLAHYELYRALAQAGNPPGLETTPSALLGDLKKELDGAVAQAATDPFGFGFPWDTYDTTSHGAGLAVMASEYDTLVGSGLYAAQEMGWLSNILGANGWGSSFIVGDGSTFPHCMQHQVTNIAGSLDGSPPILAGAAVEGPNGFAATGSLTGMRACPPDGSDRFAPFNGKTAVYKDDVQSFSTVEPAIDLTASTPLAFAWEMKGTPPPSSGGGSPVTVVTIQFDDGNADQLNALSLLSARNMAATFYINSGFIGDATHLSTTDLHTLFNAGNEIGGHTIDHANIKKLKTAAARQEVCGDRVTLMDASLGFGFPVTSFAYPFGSYDAGSEQVVHDCGYNSGRGVSGVDDTKTFAETIPPLDPYGLRMTPSIKQGTTVATVEGYVTAAETHGGGWVQLLIHHLCDQCDAYSMTVPDFTSFVDWLQGEVAAGRVVVETTDDVIGGPVNPPVPP